MTSPAPIACSLRRCRHLYGPVGPADDPLWVCEAFPMGIPEDIKTGRDLHLRPVQGDEGLVYEPPAAGDPWKRGQRRRGLRMLNFQSTGQPGPTEKDFPDAP